MNHYILYFGAIFQIPPLQPGTSLEPTERAKFKRANLDTIVSFGGDNFLDIVCRDTVSGHDIRKVDSKI